jgi:hypothetical protein
MVIGFKNWPQAAKVFLFTPDVLFDDPRCPAYPNPHANLPDAVLYLLL